VKSDFHEEVRLGATSQDVLDEYLLDLEKRGVGEYHIRDVKRYLEALSGSFRPSFTSNQTQNHLAL